MFKKFKDKLAEEVKSSPQRLQQFAQAAQAVVTSASSSISDITNNDLFSIGDSDSATKSQSSSTSQQSTFRDTSPIYQGSVQSGSDLRESVMMQEETGKQRRLSNSSFTSDVSFRLPSYESPSMYHLQSDMEISASEAEEKGFNTNFVNLDRVTKEQLYSAYRHTQDRFKKYKTQYGDLARHYKLLERENAKARNVLVETQDKALRRISELKEQCSLEQSAKAHLERALRIELDEKNMKIHALNTKLDLLQSNPESVYDNGQQKISPIEKETEMQLINLNYNEHKDTHDEAISSEISILNNKLEKMEQLLNKYKESLKVAKEKNAQMTTEIQILTNDLQVKSKQNEELNEVSASLKDSKLKIQELNDLIEELQNKCNTYEFTKKKETSILEMSLQSAQTEMVLLQSKIEELKKKEEEYAISLAENKLSIHKELESKEAEIKSLKDSLSEAQNEIQSLRTIIKDNKNNIKSLEAERETLKSDIIDYNTVKSKVNDMQDQTEGLIQKCMLLENSKANLDEQYKCLQLQMKQETAEKLAIIDRNTYLESRNAQLTEENLKKSSQISDLEKELDSFLTNKIGEAQEDSSNTFKEMLLWKMKYENLEKEIQDEREELIKLQTEIEKLLRNYELVQTKNMELTHVNSNLKQDNVILQEQIENIMCYKKKICEINNKVKELREYKKIFFDDIQSYFNYVNNEMFSTLLDKISLFNEVFKHETDKNKEKYNELKINYDLSEKELINISNKYKMTSREVQILKEEINNYNLKIQEYKSDILDKEEKLQSVVAKYDVSLNEINELKREVDNLKRKTEIDAQSHIDVEESLKTLEIDNISLREKLIESENSAKFLITTLNEEKQMCAQKLQNAEAQQEVSSKEIIILKEKINNLSCKMESDYKCHLNAAESLKTLEAENRDLRDKLIDSDNRMLLVNANLENEKDLAREKIKEINALSSKYTDLITDNDEKKNEICKLQDNIEHLKQENISLKSLSETITDNVNKLEYEMNEVRKSHAEIEREKDNLNTIIERIETSQRNEHLFVSSDKYSQTECVTQIDMINENQPFNKITEQSSYETTKVANDMEQKHNHLQHEYEVLKEENRRLKSDIEGLQTHMTKISKENSTLTDKLREYFASSDNMLEKNNAISHEIKELKSEIQSGKERIENLTRENTILVEENLELKDQIQSQSYGRYTEIKSIDDSNTTEQELKNFKEKYNSLLDAKANLENRLEDLELMNQSVTNNMQQMQVNNEKLRLSNEKLERRLDEALVSLRHLHALQENTELEYLRNILYEYLTGSGTHSLTLVKVLAAVVKFSNLQTDLVIQKEKERQGFLRQLGL